MPNRLHTFPKTARLGGRGTFKSIRDHGARDSRGPLTVWLVANDRPNSRIGISIGRIVGNAVRRNRIKRFLRESFRLMQHDLPRGYDIVIAVRPHEPLSLPEYQKLFGAMVHRGDEKWRQRKRPTRADSSEPVPRTPQPEGGDG